MHILLTHFNMWSRGAGGDGRNGVKEPGETWSRMLLHPMAIRAKCCPRPWLTLAQGGRWGALLHSSWGFSSFFTYSEPFLLWC